MSYFGRSQEWAIGYSAELLVGDDDTFNWGTHKKTRSDTMKFTLKAEHSSYTTGKVSATYTAEFEEDSLDTVLYEIKNFLKGAGYFIEGELEIVEEETE